MGRKVDMNCDVIKTISCLSQEIYSVISTQNGMKFIGSKSTPTPHPGLHTCGEIYFSCSAFTFFIQTEPSEVSINLFPVKFKQIFFDP